LAVGAESSSLWAAARGGAIEAEGLAGARPEERRVEGTGEVRQRSWTGWWHRTGTHGGRRRGGARLRTAQKGSPATAAQP
jgi:hypothetical protein